MAWRAYLETDQFTARVLQEEFVDEELFIGDEEGNLYASGRKFAACDTPLAAHELAEKLVREMTTVVRLRDGRCTSVTYLGRVHEDSPGGVSHLFARVEMHAFSRLTVGQQPKPIHKTLYDHADNDPDFAAALSLIGQPASLDAGSLYKVFELLRRSAGGTDAFLARSGWSKDQLGAFTGSLNLPSVLGAEARHAVLPGTPRQTMTLLECRDALLAVVRQWPSGGTTAP